MFGGPLINILLQNKKIVAVNATSNMIGHRTPNVSINSTVGVVVFLFSASFKFLKFSFKDFQNQERMRQISFQTINITA